jgi:hypothetical protein
MLKARRNITWFIKYYLSFTLEFLLFLDNTGFLVTHLPRAVIPILLLAQQKMGAPSATDECINLFKNKKPNDPEWNYWGEISQEICCISFSFFPYRDPFESNPRSRVGFDVPNSSPTLVIPAEKVLEAGSSCQTNVSAQAPSGYRASLPHSFTCMLEIFSKGLPC